MVVLVRQYATTRRRRWTTEVALQPTDELEQDDDDIAGSAARLDLEAALRNLPRDMRVVLVLRYFEDLSIDQTAEAIGASPGTVKSRTSRALDRLRADGVLSSNEERTTR